MNLMYSNWQDLSLSGLTENNSNSYSFHKQFSPYQNLLNKSFDHEVFSDHKNFINNFSDSSTLEIFNSSLTKSCLVFSNYTKKNLKKKNKIEKSFIEDNLDEDALEDEDFYVSMPEISSGEQLKEFHKHKKSFIQKQKNFKSEKSQKHISYNYLFSSSSCPYLSDSLKTFPVSSFFSSSLSNLEFSISPLMVENFPNHTTGTKKNNIIANHLPPLNQNSKSQANQVRVSSCSNKCKYSFKTMKNDHNEIPLIAEKTVTMSNKFDLIDTKQTEPFVSNEVTQHLPSISTLTTSNNKFNKNSIVTTNTKTSLVPTSPSFPFLKNKEISTFFEKSFPLSDQSMNVSCTSTPSVFASNAYYTPYEAHYDNSYQYPNYYTNKKLSEENSFSKENETKTKINHDPKPTFNSSIQKPNKTKETNLKLKFSSSDKSQNISNLKNCSNTENQKKIFEKGVSFTQAKKEFFKEFELSAPSNLASNDSTGHIISYVENLNSRETKSNLNIKNQILSTNIIPESKKKITSGCTKDAVYTKKSDSNDFSNCISIPAKNSYSSYSSVFTNDNNMGNQSLFITTTSPLISKGREEINYEQDDLLTLRKKNDKKSRPVTRYLPLREVEDFNFKTFLEESGHNLSQLKNLVQVSNHSVSGYLNIISSQFRVPKKRWFVLDRVEQKLRWMKSPSEKDRGFKDISFQQIESVYLDWEVRPLYSKQHQFIFCLKIKTNREFIKNNKNFDCSGNGNRSSSDRCLFLIAASAAARQVWMDAIMTGAFAYDDEY